MDDSRKAEKNNFIPSSPSSNEFLYPLPQYLHVSQKVCFAVSECYKHTP